MPPFCEVECSPYSLSDRYSKISPGWQSSALQIASNVEKRIAFALPFFKIDKFAIVMPTFSVNSVTLIFRFASITSILIIMATVSPQIIKSFSDFISTASYNNFSSTAAKIAMTIEANGTTTPTIITPGASSISANI